MTSIRGCSLVLCVIWMGLSPLILFAIGRDALVVDSMDWGIGNRIHFKDAMGMALLDTLGSYFIGDIMMGAVILRSTWLGRERWELIWRGTVYTSEELQEGMKVQFGDWLTDWLNRFR